MIRILKKLAVRTKLLSSFLLLASFVLILGVTAISIQKDLDKNQEETLASIHLANAFFEGKYFLRSDMHIFTELMAIKTQKELDYWWGEHEFQIMFFNDQLQKIEDEFLVSNSFDNDTLQTELLAITSAIQLTFNTDFIPLFNKLHQQKKLEIQNINQAKNTSTDSLLALQISSIQSEFQVSYSALNKSVTSTGLNVITTLDMGKDMVQVFVTGIETQGKALMNRTYNVFILLTILGVLFSIFVAIYISRLITRPVNKILKHVNLLGRGEQPGQLHIILQDEFGTIQHSLNHLTQSLVDTSVFSSEIGKGNFESEFHPMSENDILGNSLLQMRDSLKNARNDEEKRRVEDESRAWAANGIAKFGDVMRQSGDSLNTLGYNLTSNLVEYVGAVQGALFVINDENIDDVFYELISAVAYDRDKYLNKEIRMGESLIGRVAHEEKTIYLTDVPDNYVNITSGLGTANPTAILLIPVKLDDKVNGVIELVSFKEFSKYEIEFIEKVGENIGSFIASIKTNEKTANLLADSQHKSEELAAQEEEMRQNMEELQATQEEAARREEEQNAMWGSIGKIMGIIETDLEGNITNTNEKAANMLETGSNELLGANYKSTFLNASDLKPESIWSEIKNKQQITLDLNWTTSARSIRIIHELSLVDDIHGQSNKVLCLLKVI